MTSRSAAALAAALCLFTACALEPVDLEDAKPLPLRSTIFAADGTILARLYEQNRAYAPLRRIPRHLVRAVLAAEDARFFRHGGFDLRATARAAFANLERGDVVQGGSTITQQYVKNVYFNSAGRTLERKARELRLALEVERRYSKREILERYLNTVYFGSGAYGVKAAAEAYFRRGLTALSTADSALLAAVIKAPALYDPRAHPRRARARRDYVLARMRELGYLTRRAVSRAGAAPLGVAHDPPRVPAREPYFVEAVRQEILADPRFGRTRDQRDARLREGGLRVDTTLVPSLQDAADDAVASVLDQPGDPEAALVAIRPRTGRIVAMIGGRDWSASQVNLALGAEGGGSGRQPGSAFKPIAAAAALEAGLELDDVYESSPIAFTLPGGETWPVRNAEGQGYGLMSLHEALVHSVNGVYARLAMQLGGDKIAAQAEAMGVRSRLAPVPSIALGAGEVSVVDMAAAYATLANRGTAVTPTTLAAVRLPGGQTLEPRQQTTPQVVSEGNAYLLTRALEQVIERGTGRAADIGRPAAGKTGTTNDYADAWFVGYTPHLVAAVWVGYPQGRIPMTSVHGISVTGGSLPAAIWRTFMLRAHAGLPVQDFFAPPSAFVELEIDPATGLLAAPWCPGEKRVVLRELAPTDYCPPPPSPSPTPTPTPTEETPTPSPTEETPTPTPTSSPGRGGDGGTGGEESRPGAGGP
ncbi:MAG TPA: PBP1A family penicillin-binding protein [Actinomycetota bacterium]|nr:PBP1A family penicillin-binding protein [Actinomycetota bacterium]